MIRSLFDLPAFVAEKKFKRAIHHYHSGAHHGHKGGYVPHRHLRSEFKGKYARHLSMPGIASNRPAYPFQIGGPSKKINRRLARFEQRGRIPKRPVRSPIPDTRAKLAPRKSWIQRKGRRYGAGAWHQHGSMRHGHKITIAGHMHISGENAEHLHGRIRHMHLAGDKRHIHRGEMQ